MARERRRNRDRVDDRGQDLHAQILRDDETGQYTSVLMDKFSGEDYPSLDQLRRLQRFA